MTCESCGSDKGTSNGRCASCGAKIPTRADRVRALNPKRERQETDQQINRGRRWMLIEAVLTLFGGAFTYFSGTSDVEKQIKAADAAFEGMTSAERDAQVKATVGMTRQEAIDHDRRIYCNLPPGPLLSLVCERRHP